MGATAAVRRQAGARGRKAARAVGGSRSARIAARTGFLARTVFYLLLAGLVARAAYDGGTAGGQTNSHGALSVIAETVLGKVAIAGAALGFAALGVVRIAGAVRDRRATWRERALTGAQGAFYLALTWVPLSFLFGSHRTGSEQAQHQDAAALLSWPAGREIVAALGLVVVGVCCYQIWTAVTQDFTDGLSLRRAPRWVRWFAEGAGTIGIAARALVFLPVGVFLVVAAVQSDPQHANGLDAELGVLARQSWWGPALLGVVAAGLVIFAAYSAIEAGYRRVARAG